jgi:hypothetical protein
MAGAGLGLGVAFAGQMANAGQAGPPQTPAPGIPGAGGGMAPGGAPTAGGAGAITCGKCGHQVAPGKFCADCGAPLAAPGPKFCSNCGGQMPGGAKFCSGCGTAVPA